MIYDLQSGDQGLKFKEALDEVKDFASTPGISLTGARGILTDADRTTHPKRLRRWAKRYPRKQDLLGAMMALGQPERMLSISADLLAPLAGHAVPVAAFGVPVTATCEGTGYFYWNGN
jgi:hypothetical protein